MIQGRNLDKLFNANLVASSFTPFYNKPLYNLFLEVIAVFHTFIDLLYSFNLMYVNSRLK